MPRIRAPADNAILARAREFALFRQLQPAADGSVSQEALEALLSKYGSGAKPSSDDLTFEQFAELVKRAPTVQVDGDNNCVGYAAHSPTDSLKPWSFKRRAPLPTDVHIKITHAGICHSDLHQVKNEWNGTTYPIVPGHEIVGYVVEVGSEVTKFKVGDRVGVGCMVNSCGKCRACAEMHEEQYCEVGSTMTYNGKDPADGTTTYGGYSTAVLVNEKFVLRVPEKISLDGAAPLLCAGITVYSPIKHFGLDKPGMSVGVVGLGGLGHMAVRFLKSFGVTTTVISTSPGKREEALKVLGADNFIVSKDPEQMKAAAGTLDGLVNTVSAPHDLAALLSLLKVDGTMACVGAPPDPPLMPTFSMLFRRLRVAGSLIGGIKETQEMLDYCAEKGVECMHETIAIEKVNEAYERMLKNDVRYRFVIDIQGSLIQ